MVRPPLMTSTSLMRTLVLVGAPLLMGLGRQSEMIQCLDHSQLQPGPVLAIAAISGVN